MKTLSIACVAIVAVACGGNEDDTQFIGSAQQGVYNLPGGTWLTPKLPPPPSYPTPGTGSGSSIPLVTTQPYCGDGTCNTGETCKSCPRDCGSCCGNGTCDAGENFSTCPGDCPTCGNGVVDPGEQCDGPTSATCDQAATAQVPTCGTATVGCKNCRFDTSGCRMWWTQIQVCVSCSPAEHCLDPKKGLWACREPDGSCTAWTGL
ncbi:MAG: hypothetical protein KC503_03205 [Myxococcales bacterium]|nr:hypothetical protein [Myxococcales bacterium]